MPHIRVLSDDLINQIAAGEVIERPASVVKELVENSLDAEATRIGVEIEQGGIRRIRVVDDGTGLSPEDARQAFTRHATSKIATSEDLAHVGTLGFRGEALPSIASVARVRMRTRRPEDAIGLELEGHGEGIDRVREVACPAGTSVEVAELFERVPARRKFLKTPVTEGTHVVRWLERIALARPDVRIALERDGRESLAFLPTRDPRERAIAVLPPSVGSKLVPVEAETEHVRLTGYTTPTDVMRGTTADIHLFVNSRPVRDRFLLHLVRDAYRDALPSGRHPAAVLWLQVDPSYLDINVHPAKWEVRFRDPGAVRRVVSEGLSRAAGARARVWAPSREAPPVGSVRELPLGGGFELARTGGVAPGPVFEGAEGGRGPAPRPPFRFSSLRYLGQALASYLVLESPEGLILFDQHAAHERVLFERMRSALLGGKLERQALLIPAALELERSAADALLARTDLLARAGLEVEEGDGAIRGGVRILVRSVPDVLADRRGVDWQALLEETAAFLRDPTARAAVDGLEGALHHTLATAACHSACRKGDRLEPAEVRALLEALDDVIWFPNCPHGRPIWMHLSEGDLERHFLRR